jgi:phosphodiesterase/alkaline phosphatase D-like protein
MKRILLFALICISFSTAAAQFRRAIFLHHSVGASFWGISLASPPTTIPIEIAAYNSAHGYTGANAVSMSELYFPNQDASGTANNNWVVWNTLFSGGSFNGSTMDYSTPIIVIKTCYLQQQAMTSSADIATLQGYIRSIVSVMASHPNNFFVIWNNYPAGTDGLSSRAVWSAQFSVWMKDVLATGNDSYGAFPRNVYVFDVFRKLADGTTGYCPPNYAGDGGYGGDHPSLSAIGIVDPQFVKETFDAAIAYEGAASGPSAPTAGAASSVTSSSFTANWSASSGATGYRLDVSTSIGFGTFVTGYGNKDIGNATSAPVSGLTPGTPYYFRVRAYNSVGTSSSSATITVTTSSNPSAPSAPVAGAATGIGVEGFTANWSDSAGATGYFLDVAKDNAFSLYVSGYQNRDVSLVTSFGVSGLSAGTLYYYRVRAYNLNGTSDNSSTIPVTTSAPSLPASPTALPAAAVTATTFTAAWSSVAGATGYFLDVLTSGGTDTTLHIGDSVMVSFSTDGVNARSIPSTTGSTILKLEFAGTRGVIVAGPSADVNASSLYTFWRITYSDGITGWSASTYLTKILGSFVSGYNNKDVGNVTSAGVSGLSGNTSYYYRVRAYNANGAGGNSNTISVTTGSLAAPAVTTAAATNITSTGMQLNGSVNPNGLATTYHFDYGTTTGYGQSTAIQSGGSGGSAVAVNAVVSGLTPGTLYHFRLVATSSGGSALGNDANALTGGTSAPPPTVVTAPAASPTTTGAQLNGSVNPNGYSTTCYFEYGPTAGYGEATPVQNVGAGQASVPVSATVNGLTAGTLYHYHLVAQNIGGTRNGTDTTFATLPLAVTPAVTTAGATAITSTGMQFNGSVNPNGTATTYHFDYGTTTGYGQSTAIQNAGSGGSAVAVKAVVGGLTPGTLYHYHLVAQNIGGTRNGTDTMFATLPSAVTPKDFVLLQNYPNPFNPTTTIIYRLPHKTFVALTVFNTLGQPIVTLVSGEQDAGYHEAVFDGSNLSSGTYFYRLQTTDDLEVRKIVLVH